MNTALLLIDIQNDFFPGGRMPLAGSVEAGRRAGELLLAFRCRGLPTVHIQHVMLDPQRGFFLPGTAGMQIHESVAPLTGETVFQKHYPNSFRDTPLLAHLKARGIHELVIAGMMTHMCVDTTTRAAADFGFKCRLAYDACATRDLSFEGGNIPAAQVHTAHVAGLSGVFATVQPTRELCAAMEGVTA